MTDLTNISPLDGRYHKKLDTLRPIVSEYGLIFYRTCVEVAWLKLLIASPDIQETGKMTPQIQTALNSIIDNFSAQDVQRVKDIEQTTNHDVKAVEYFIQEKLKALSLTQFIPFIHFACTSEDINNLAYGLMVRDAFDNIIEPELKSIIQNIHFFAKKHAHLSMLSRTHGQSATPTTLGKELKNVVERLQRQLNRLKQREILGKFNGAVGNYNAHKIAYPNINWPELNKSFVEGLGLTWNSHTTQIEPHDFIAELMHNIIRVNTILIDFNRNIWSYISLGYFKQKSVANEVGSSTMPHKINPIDFENAEGNLGLANAIADHLALKLPISRWQRDLTDSTVMRNLGTVFGYSALAYQSTLKGLSKLEANEKLISDDLSQHWEVLAEAVQTVMRRYGIADAYEQLKAFSRGKPIDKNVLQSFIDQLTIPAEEKSRLKQLTPADYIGYAAELAD